MVPIDDGFRVQYWTLASRNLSIEFCSFIDPEYKNKMAEEIAAEYRTSLEDLTFNSKPVINMLTMVAEENIEHAEEITRVIQERINKVHDRVQQCNSS